MKYFIDTRTGQAVKAIPAISGAFPNGAAFTVFYPEGIKATISREIFNLYFELMWPQPDEQPQGAA